MQVLVRCRVLVVLVRPLQVVLLLLVLLLLLVSGAGQMLIGRRRGQAQWRTAGQLLVTLVLAAASCIGRAHLGHNLLLGSLGQHQILLDVVVVIVVVVVVAAAAAI